MAAYLCLIALFFVIINLVVDLLYYAVDPRLRIERDCHCALHDQCPSSASARYHAELTAICGATCTRIPSSASRSTAPRASWPETLAALRHRDAHAASARPASSA